MTRSDLYGFMKRHPLAVLGTVTPDGQPQAALMRTLVTPELELFFDTRCDTRKYRNFLTNPQCSFVIGCSGPASAQFDGVLETVGGDELERLKRSYFAAAPQRDRSAVAWLIARPRRILYSDYSEHPPLLAEFTF